MLVLRPEAERDVSEAFAWYEERERGLGVDFLAEVEGALLRLEASPALCPKVHRDVRRALTRRFPFGVFFVAEPARMSCSPSCTRPEARATCEDARKIADARFPAGYFPVTALPERQPRAGDDTSHSIGA